MAGKKEDVLVMSEKEYTDWYFEKFGYSPPPRLLAKYFPPEKSEEKSLEEWLNG